MNDQARPSGVLTLSLKREFFNCRKFQIFRLHGSVIKAPPFPTKLVNGFEGWSKRKKDINKAIYHQLSKEIEKMQIIYDGKSRSVVARG